jgi:aminoglycoside 6'-N-acetyltransferase
VSGDDGIGTESPRVRGQLTAVRPAGEEDADLLVRWHGDPEVARFWDDETFTREEMLERLARADVDSFIVEEGDRPVGYLQTWREGDAGGLDMFLIPGARGRGLGPDAARAVATDLKRRGWPRVTVDPYTWNDAAVRAWRKAGFVDVEEREPDEEHRARWLLMEFRP